MKEFRDRLVQTIRDCGLELMDRAESMVSEDTGMITGFNIYIDIPMQAGEIPEIRYEASVLNRTALEHIRRSISPPPIGL